MPSEESFGLSPSQIAYLGRNMERLSRSFAVVVPYLESPLDHIVAAAYLLCRVVDNIEDCGHGFEQQAVRYDEFLQMLNQPATSSTILRSWDADSWPELTEPERSLMNTAGGLELWQIYAGIPMSLRAGLETWIGTMAYGMRSVSDMNARPEQVTVKGISVLADVDDYNLYCYYVAGTVGHMATELAVDFYGFDGSVAGTMNENCEALGRGLQKTNILKDFAEDRARGVCFLPDVWLQDSGYSPLYLRGASAMWTARVIEDILSDLRGATEAIALVPYTAVGFRKACMMAMLPAYETILLAAQRSDVLFTKKHKVKISRITMAKIMRQLKSMVSSNDHLVRYSKTMDRAVRETLGVT